jgi:hypothetical protein
MAKAKAKAKPNGHANGHTRTANRKPKPRPVVAIDAAKAPVTAAKFFEILRDIESAERRKQTAVATLRNAYKRAHEIGVNVPRLKDARKLREFTESELASELNTLIGYSKHLKVPVYGQLPLIETKAPSEDDVVTLARDRGTVAGRCGEDADKNPWTLDTPAGRAWLEARDKGAAEFSTGA